MITYLYVKTHTITGLKYLGKTIQKDPHKYKGSGTYWCNHLRKHGATYTTEILKECEDPAMVNFWGQHYSDLWNIVQSDEWANLKPETGTGGWEHMKGYKHSPETLAKIKATAGNRKGKSNSAEHNQKIRLANPAAKRRDADWKPSQESIDKMIETRKANYDKYYSPERNAKMSESKKGTKRQYQPDGSFKYIKS